MSKNRKIEKSPKNLRIHFIEEWINERGMSKTAFADKVGTDKSNVTKWCKGALPSEKSLMEVANALDIEPNDVFRAPDERWLAKFFRETDESERDRALTLLAAAFPGKIEK